VEHEISHERGQGCVYAVHFQATLYGSVSLLELLGYPYCIAGGEYGAFLQTNSEQLAHEFAVKSPGWMRAMSMLISQVLLHLLRFESASFTARGQSEMQAELPRLLPALTWMHDHLGDPAVHQINGTKPGAVHATPAHRAGFVPALRDRRFD